MPAQLVKSDGDGALRIDGALDVSSVSTLWQQSGGHMPCDGGATLDLSGVTRTDSAGVALLVHWVREQQGRDGRLRFVNIPPQIHAIARVSGVVAILELIEDAGSAPSGPPAGR